MAENTSLSATGTHESQDSGIAVAHAGQYSGRSSHSHQNSPYALLATQFSVIRRNSQKVAFDGEKISIAITKAFLGVEGGTGAASTRIHEVVESLTKQVIDSLTKRRPEGGLIHIEDIQDQVELALMRTGEHKVARAYVLYREERDRRRRESQGQPKGDDKLASAEASHLLVTLDNGNKVPLQISELRLAIENACKGLSNPDSELILKNSLHNLFDGATRAEVNAALVMGTRTLLEKEPDYSQVAARLLLNSLYDEALSEVGMKQQRFTKNAFLSAAHMEKSYAQYFEKYIQFGVQKGLLSEVLEQYDLARLGKSLKAKRDLQFHYLGLQTLYDRYFINHCETRIELPQAFFMRVAMGLAVNEPNRETRTIEFYDLLSSFDFMSSTPTLFNSGTPRPQLSSCYLTTVPDNLDGIFSAIKDDALLSKFAGGLGNDWSQVRALGAHIRGTNGKSQGVVPFLKVANDTAVAVNQGGKRKGAVCAYLETWHLDIEEFLELRKNTGDERRRTHDMNTAHWIPDLFMKRVANEKPWMLFSPDDVPDLHDLYGTAFEKRYEEYEQLANEGKIKNCRKIPAVDLWRKMLSMLFETGHPWITFKDPCNLRSPQSHVGVVHSSNLCTEITLNTSEDEIAVCNLGSINLAQHTDENGLMSEKLRKTITTAMRLLDNVIDYNYYSVPQARHSNLRHRPVGLGIMGFQDALYQLRIPYASEEAVEFADRSMEEVSYYAIEASADLARERGNYLSFENSLWQKGILPIDSVKRLAEQRGEYFELDQSQRMDWKSLCKKVSGGMRNSNCLAIAPTATISNICGVSPSIEPIYQNLFVKSNLSGEFTITNHWLINDLKKLGLWDDVMINDLQYFDGKLADIDRIPEDLKALYATAFEIDPCWLVEAAARRQKWLDQSQSLNLYLDKPSGKKIDNLYKLAWVRGLKTTYYLRSLGATHMEKSTNDRELIANKAEQAKNACSIIDPDCEACQ
ncbi:MAG: ribonucleoside-diphosphate reductase subunit alpha [Candidatus Eutrophobiaceae bacterium]